MFARKVTARLHANCLNKFTALVEGAIIPWLRGQDGFRDLIILSGSGGTEVTTISFWDHEADAEAYNANGYPKVLQALAQMLDGVPRVQMFDVVSSTFPSLARLPGAASLSQDTDPGCDFRVQQTSA